MMALFRIILVMVMFVAALAGNERVSANDSLSEPVRSAVDRLIAGGLSEKRDAFLQLESLREPEAVPYINQYIYDQDPEIRSYALRALIAVEGAKAVGTLLDALHNDRSIKVRRAALLGIEPYYKVDQRVVDVALEMLDDRSKELAMTAVDVVSRMELAVARKAILQRAKKERRRDVKRVLNLALARMDES